MIEQTTNPKIASVSVPPQWAPFGGISLLFDHKPCCYKAMNDDFEMLHCVEGCQDRTQLFEVFSDFRRGLGASYLAEQFTFCPTSPKTYHVTVWDGINSGNVASLSDVNQAKYRTMIDGLPDSLLYDNEALSLAERSDIVSHGRWNLTMKFGTLYQWKESVLVAGLVPSDEASIDLMTRLNASRNKLIKQFTRSIGITSAHDYVPHFTLGYYATVDGAHKAELLLPQWNEILTKRTNGLSVTFGKVSLFGFIDMQTFFRKKVR